MEEENEGSKPKPWVHSQQVNKLKRKSNFPTFLGRLVSLNCLVHQDYHSLMIRHSQWFFHGTVCSA